VRSTNLAASTYFLPLFILKNLLVVFAGSALPQLLSDV
jgi:hypothetical protein